MLSRFKPYKRKFTFCNILGTFLFLFWARWTSSRVTCQPRLVLRPRYHPPPSTPHFFLTPDVGLLPHNKLWFPHKLYELKIKCLWPFYRRFHSKAPTFFTAFTVYLFFYSRKDKGQNSVPDCNQDSSGNVINVIT